MAGADTIHQSTPTPALRQEEEAQSEVVEKHLPNRTALETLSNVATSEEE